jgi:hypothetical protein
MEKTKDNTRKDITRREDADIIWIMMAKGNIQL